MSENERSSQRARITRKSDPTLRQLVEKAIAYYNSLHPDSPTSIDEFDLSVPKKKKTKDRSKLAYQKKLVARHFRQNPEDR